MRNFVGDVKQLLRVLCYSYQVVKRLVEGISDTSGLVNVSDEEGWTPLHSAASSGREAMVELLLDLGADVAAANKGGRVALHYAASKGHVAIADLLLKRGAKINQKDKVLPSGNIFYLTLDFCTGSLSQYL
jgi:26S proteasome non-ATPase regulatory subunit 10